MGRLKIKNCKIVLTEAAIISALASKKIDEDEYLTGEEILPSDQRRVI